MNYNKYFEKYGYVYGVSYKLGMSNSAYMKKFDNIEEAENWLNAEEYDFRTRELCSKSRAESIVR